MEEILKYAKFRCSLKGVYDDVALPFMKYLH